MTKSPLYEKVIAELSYFKFRRNSLAYEYLINAIMMVNEDSYYIKNFSNLYKDISMRYQTETSNVKWNITKLIALMYLNTQEDIIQEYFNLLYYEKPSPKAFIIYISKKIDYDIYQSEMMKV